jgi:2'-5' RNA ligase
VPHNLFFALWPDDDVREHIAAAAQDLKQTHGPRGRWIKPPRYHLTLRYLGEHPALPDALLTAAYAAGDAVGVPAFDFALDTADSFANRRIPWWLGCEAMPGSLDTLWDAVADGLRARGVATDEPAPRIAHVTILRDADRRLAPERIASIAWPVRDFVLVDSQLGAESRYTILKRWPLARDR